MFFAMVFLFSAGAKLSAACQPVFSDDRMPFNNERMGFTLTRS